MVTLLRLFQKTYRILVDRKNYAKDIIEAIMVLRPDIILDEPECLYSEIQIVLDGV